MDALTDHINVDPTLGFRAPRLWRVVQRVVQLFVG